MSNQKFIVSNRKFTVRNQKLILRNWKLTVSNQNFTGRNRKFTVSNRKFTEAHQKLTEAHGSLLRSSRKLTVVFGTPFPLGRQWRTDTRHWSHEAAARRWMLGAGQRMKDNSHWNQVVA